MFALFCIYRYWCHSCWWRINVEFRWWGWWLWTKWRWWWWWEQPWQESGSLGSTRWWVLSLLLCCVVFRLFYCTCCSVHNSSYVPLFFLVVHVPLLAGTFTFHLSSVWFPSRSVSRFFSRFAFCIQWVLPDLFFIIIYPGLRWDVRQKSLLPA